MAIQSSSYQVNQPRKDKGRRFIGSVSRNLMLAAKAFASSSASNETHNLQIAASRSSIQIINQSVDKTADDSMGPNERSMFFQSPKFPLETQEE